MSGFNGPPPAPDGLWADDQVSAWDLYRANADTHGYPTRLCGRWFLPLAVRTVNEVLAAEAVRLAPGPITTPHKGSSAEAARLHEWDKGRIDERVRRRRGRREREERDDDDDRPQQASLFG